MTNETNEATATNDVDLAIEITLAWLSNANTRAGKDEVLAFLSTMHQTVKELTAGPEAEGDKAQDAAPEYTGAVTARKSLASRDFIISMIDGKPYKTLTRHLTTNGLTASEYRSRYGLKADYPMTAPAYSEARRAMAKEIGLGRKPGQKMPVKAATKPKGITAAKKAAQAHLNAE